MEILLTILKGLGIFILLIPFAFWITCAAMGITVHEMKFKEFPLVAKIYLGYYPSVMVAALMVYIIFASLYIMGKDFGV